MKHSILVTLSLLCTVVSPAISAAEMECAEFESGEAVCDDGSHMFHRANPSASFVMLDDATRLKVIAYLSNLAENGGTAAQNDDASSGGSTNFFGSSGSITRSGGCVSLSSPGVSFMGSGC